MSLAVQNLWGQVAGRSTEHPGETGTVSPSLAAAPPAAPQPRSPPAPASRCLLPCQPQIPDLHLHLLGHQEVACRER